MGLKILNINKVIFLAFVIYQWTILRVQIPITHCKAKYTTNATSWNGMTGCLTALIILHEVDIRDEKSFWSQKGGCIGEFFITKDRGQ